MAYRLTKIEHVISDSSDLKQVLFSRAPQFYQSLDLEVFSTAVNVGTSDSEAAIAIAPVATGYNLFVSSDYPILLRVNGTSATQFTLNSNNVAATNAGAPLPDQCCFFMTGQTTSVRVAPISGATQTAHVKISVTGDPTNSYT